MFRKAILITIGVFITLLQASCMMSQQQPSAVSQAFPDLAAHIDPNLPGPTGQPGLKVGWVFTGSILQPSISIKSECNASFGDRMNVTDYLGWNAKGSWLLGADYCVYVWNLHSNSLTMMYRAPNEIPAAEFDSMRSPAEIYAFPVPDKRMDPNFPTVLSPDPDGLRVGWQYGNVTGVPTVWLTRFVFERTPGHWQRISRVGAEYFGWNDKGSLIKNQQDGRIYFWNLKQDSLRVAYPDERSIPPGVLASLHKLDNVASPLAVAMSPKK